MASAARRTITSVTEVPPATWEAAIAEARVPRANVAQVAAKYGVARGTLLSRMKSGNTGVTRKGPAPILGVANEALIAQHLLWMVDAGYGLSKMRLQHFARSCAAQAGFTTAEFHASTEWVASFMRRHPELSYRKSKKVNGSRAKNFNRISVVKWFKVWTEIVAQYRPEEIVNVDDKHLNPEELLDKKVSSVRGRGARRRART